MKDRLNVDGKTVLESRSSGGEGTVPDSDKAQWTGVEVTGSRRPESGYELLSACWQHIVVSQTGIEAQYRTDLGRP